MKQNWWGLADCITYKHRKEESRTVFFGDEAKTRHCNGIAWRTGTFDIGWTYEWIRSNRHRGITRADPVFPEQGITVILSSHILSEVQLLADKVGIISGGILGYEGALKQGDNLEDLFMNVVRKTRKQVKSMVNIIKAEHQKAKRTMRKSLSGDFLFLHLSWHLYLLLGWQMLMQKVFGTGGIHFCCRGWLLYLLSFCGAGEKIKYYHLMTIPTDRRKLLLGKIIYIGYMILFSNVIVFAGATLGGFLLTTHVPVGGALIAVLFLTVSELWEIPVALF